MKETTIYLTKEFEERYTYTGDDLGCMYAKEGSSFRVYAPTAQKVWLLLFQDGLKGEAYEKLEMKASEKGTFQINVSGDLDGVFYLYEAEIDGEKRQAVDPYAKAVGVNGIRGMVVDLEKTNPEGFVQEKRPQKPRPTDSVIYEVHVRDFSIDESSQMKNKGKFLAFTEGGLETSNHVKIGLEHLKELGVTHVHLLPSFDYGSVDETKLDTAQYNWGYDPVNYNVPEGSYSTNPYDGAVRIKEFKEMVQALHKNGICVVMDVVYNHVYDAEKFCYQKLVPDYFFRKNGEEFSNASACGNETASNHFMVRKYMIDSLCYWAREYHVDGFRFDLMAIHDILTMNEIRKALDEIDKDILIYGEGWAADEPLLPKEERALKEYTYRMPGIASFSDDVRDGIRGCVFLEEEKGFVSGEPDLEDIIKFSVTGAVGHSSLYSAKQKEKIRKDIPSQVRKDLPKPWALTTEQCVNYSSCHDNYTLWDKLCISNPGASKEQLKKMNKLAAAIYFTCQGICFLQAGEDFLRTKEDKNEPYGFKENSYNSSDAINGIHWNQKEENMDIFRYYQGLISFRKSVRGLHLITKDDVEQSINFIESELGVVAFTIKTSEELLFICYNSNNKQIEMGLPEGTFDVYVNDERAGTEILKTVNGKIAVEPISAVVLKYHKDTLSKGLER